ncbi:MAG: response regulator [Omnitrophica bacterium]|nr:response regulator [Candidatus Omnitrophota bacterium]
MFKEEILIVDDRKIIRDIFISAFSEYKIIAAGCGQEALEILKNSQDIKLVVLDVIMPGLSGTELLTEIRKIKPNIKIIISTGQGVAAREVKTLRLDTDGFIEKPFDITKVKKLFDKLVNLN